MKYFWTPIFLFVLCSFSICQTNLTSDDQKAAVPEVKAKVLSIQQSITNPLSEEKDQQRHIVKITYSVTTQRPRIVPPCVNMWVLYEDKQGIRNLVKIKLNQAKKEQNSSTLTTRPIVCVYEGLPIKQSKSKTTRQIVAIHVEIKWGDQVLDSLSLPDENTLKARYINPDWFNKKPK